MRQGKGLTNEAEDRVDAIHGVVRAFHLDGLALVRRVVQRQLHGAASGRKAQLLRLNAHL